MLGLFIILMLLFGLLTYPLPSANAIFFTDDALKESIVNEFPAWDHLSDWERVSTLRHWAAQRIDMSSATLFLHDNASFHFYFQNVSVILDAFERNWGGVWCAGTAWTLKRLYELFGYESYYLATGDPGNSSYPALTHAETLAYIDVNSSRILSIQDAYFDVSYTDREGRPLDYFQMLHLLRDQKHEEIKIVPSSDEGVTRDMILRANETAKWKRFRWIEFPESYVPLDGDKRLYRITFSLDSFGKYHAGAQNFKELLVHDGYPRNLLYIHLYPYQVDVYTLNDLSVDSSASNAAGLDMLRTAVDIATGRFEGKTDGFALWIWIFPAGAVVATSIFALFWTTRRRSRVR